MSTFLVRFGLWLARCGGWVDRAAIVEGQRRATMALLQAERARTKALENKLAALETPLLADARLTTAHIEEKFSAQSGEFKRAQALRMLLNRNPDASERDCAYAIELALR